MHGVVAAEHRVVGGGILEDVCHLYVLSSSVVGVCAQAAAIRVFLEGRTVLTKSRMRYTPDMRWWW